MKDYHINIFYSEEDESYGLRTYQTLCIARHLVILLKRLWKSCKWLKKLGWQSPTNQVSRFPLLDTVRQSIKLG